MSVGYDWTETTVSVYHAVLIVLLASVVGYTVGFLFTVHFVPTLAEAVWLTTVSLVVIGLFLWGARRS